MSVKKKTVLLALMLAGVMGLSGCKTWDVVCDIHGCRNDKSGEG